MNHLFLSFYVLEARQNNHPNHERLVDIIIPKIIGIFTILFFYTLNAFLFLLSKINLQVPLREYKWSIIILLVVIAFMGISFLKKKILKKYPNFIDPELFDKKQIKYFKWTLYGIIALIFIPVSILAYFLFLSMN